MLFFEEICTFPAFFFKKVCRIKINAYLCNPIREVRGNSSVGRAQPCQGWGREFEPRFPLQNKSKSAEMLTYFLKQSLRLDFTELRLRNIHPTGFNHMSVVLVHKGRLFCL